MDEKFVLVLVTALGALVEHEIEVFLERRRRRAGQLKSRRADARPHDDVDVHQANGNGNR